jgi:hypothetical protein
MKMSERKQPQGATMNYIFELSSLPCLSLQWHTRRIMLD